MGALLDLILPAVCAGCHRAGVAWCARCDAALYAGPARVRPRCDPGVPCWALGPYRGPARQAVLAAKERGRRDLAGPLGAALAAALDRLRTPGLPLVLVPAPTRAAAARRRGGDPVTAAARRAAGSLRDCHVAPMLRLGAGARDSVGLTTDQRIDNLRGRVRVARRGPDWTVGRADAEVVVVDDVLTTGATVTEVVRVMGRSGLLPRAVLVTCAA
ncbi:ComF family protein [Nocardia thailandica]|uniref:ComF family protein n=1 Tax=Nocardia thailandica TaxID=257275 RepID=A0ABW6PKW3_9NOCA